MSASPLSPASQPMSLEYFTACRWVFAIHDDASTSVWRDGAKVMSVSVHERDLGLAVARFEARAAACDTEAERLANLFVASIVGRVQEAGKQQQQMQPAPSAARERILRACLPSTSRPRTSTGPRAAGRSPRWRARA